MIESFTVRMTSLNRDRKVTVYLPQSYETSTDRYPVLYMHDGQNVFRDEEANYGTSWGIPDYLDQSSINLIVVGIDCNHHRFERFNEYGPWVNHTISRQVIDTDEPLGGEGPAYIDFLVHELKPFIDKNYRTIPDDTSMMGSSMGGLISTYAACKYPAIFKKVASVSSAYWFNQKEIEELVTLSDLSRIEKFYLDIGTQEVSSKVDAKQYVASSLPIYDVLKTKVPSCKFEIVEGAEHNEAAWRKRVPAIFNYLYQS